MAHIGKGAHHYERLDANALFEAAIENLHYDVANTRADIHVATLPNVCGERTQLIRLFQNVLANAIKYRKPGRPPRIEVAAANYGDEWRISIADDGIGIEPKNQGRVFEFFSRLHADHDYSGIGLGLAMCKRIVENHRGQIWFDSKLGQGTTFHFTLPKVEAPAGYRHHRESKVTRA